MSFKHEYYKIMATPIHDEDPSKLYEVCWDVIGTEELRFFIYWNGDHFLSKSDFYLFSWKDLSVPKKKLQTILLGVNIYLSVDRFLMLPQQSLTPL